MGKNTKFHIPVGKSASVPITTKPPQQPPRSSSVSFAGGYSPESDSDLHGSSPSSSSGPSRGFSVGSPKNLFSFLSREKRTLWEIAHLVDMSNYDAENPGVISDYKVMILPEALFPLIPALGQGFYLFTQDNEILAKVFHGAKLTEEINLSAQAQTLKQKKLLEKLDSNGDSIKLQTFIKDCCEHKPLDSPDSYIRQKANSAISKKFKDIQEGVHVDHGEDCLLNKGEQADEMLANMLSGKNNRMNVELAKVAVEWLCMEIQTAKNLNQQELKKSITSLKGLEGWLTTLNKNKTEDETKRDKKTDFYLDKIQTHLRKLSTFFDDNFKQAPLIRCVFKALHEFYTDQLKESDPLANVAMDYVYLEGKVFQTKSGRQQSPRDSTEKVMEEPSYEFKGTSKVIYNGHVMKKTFPLEESRVTPRRRMSVSFRRDSSIAITESPRKSPTESPKIPDPTPSPRKK